MDLSAVIERLKASLTGIARQVEGAAGLEAALKGIATPPAVFVLPLADKGREMPTTGVTRQHMTHLFAVLLCVENFRHALGGAAVVDLETLRKPVRAALIGWVPEPSNGEPVLFVGGELIQFEGDGRLWWSDEFLLTSYYRSTS